MLEPTEPTRPASSRPGGGDRLNSWKEIAAYLGREQRTVQRWERFEGLPVHRLHHGKAGSVYAIRSELDAWVSQRSGGEFNQPAVKQARSPRKLLAGSVAVVIVFTAALLVYRQSPDPVVPTPVPFTSDPGLESDARLSPDASRVVYVWNGEAEDNFDIYIRSDSGGAPVRLTSDPAIDYSPAWSPDGTVVAFLRRSGASEASVLIIPAKGGSERGIAGVRSAAWSPWSRSGPFLAWSPDGKWLVVSGSQEPNRPDVLLCVSIDKGEMRPLTTLPSQTMGDMAPAFSPDGRMLAFSRLLSWGRSAVYLLPLTPAMLPAGELREIKTGSTWNASPAWTPDGRSLIVSSGTMDAPYLVRTEIDGSALRRIFGAGDYGWMPHIANASGGRGRLVYTQHFESVNIWRTSIQAKEAPVRLIASSHWSYEPAWSSDSRRIVFLSDRTGYGEIWVADADGRHTEQWTFLKQPRLGSPRWSPDGRRIAFTAPGERGSSIYVIDAPGATPRPVQDSHECGYLDWARDGRAIFFSSSRGGTYDIWRVALDGGEAVRVTYNRGRVPRLSIDGRYLYYLKLSSADGRNDLWRAPLGGGTEEKILDFVDAYSVGETGIAFKYYRPGVQPVGPHLQFFRFSTGLVERLPDAPRPLRYGIALSPDERHLLHSQSDYEVSDIMLVEGFR